MAAKLRMANPETTETLRHKLIADLYDLRIWERGPDRVVTGWEFS